MGDAAATIATGLAELMAEGYGHGPASQHAIIEGNIVVVLLEEAFSPAERRLVELGKTDEIKQIRRLWQADMEQDFRQIVEEATGRQVRAFISDTDVRAELSVEVFVLADATTDMDGFEAEAEAQTDEVGESERT